MKVKVYKVYPKDKPDLWYFVDAPSKRIAKWCGAAILNNIYCNFLAAKHMEAKRFRAGE
jgi:hypothetical protein